MSKIVVFITSYNRKDTTIRFLESLHKSISISTHSFEIYLVDDASPDLTGKYVEKSFPYINILMGNGKLYWAGGVRLILAKLEESIFKFDAILLLNDDIVLKPEKLEQLIEIGLQEKSLIGGTVTTSSGIVESSGSKLGKICKPKVRRKLANGELQECDVLPGHIMFIPVPIYAALGGFDEELPYRFLDLEFSLRASRAGFPVLLAPEVVALTDEVHDYFKETSRMRGSLRQLMQEVLLHPKGPHIRESIIYLRKVSPLVWWLWLPFFYRAFFVAVFRSYFEKLPFITSPATPVTLEK
jgi:GT2 family glycosyltransferase